MPHSEAKKSRKLASQLNRVIKKERRFTAPDDYDNFTEQGRNRASELLEVEMLEHTKATRRSEKTFLKCSTVQPLRKSGEN